MPVDLTPFRIDPNRSARQLRGDGALLLLLGGVMMAILVLVALAHLQVFDVLALVPGLTRDPAAASTPPSIGSRLVFGLLAAFAAMTLAEGAWRVAFGARNAWLTRALVALAIVFFIGGYAVMALQGERVLLPRL